MAFLTEDRKRSGLYLNLSVKDNIAIASLKDHLKGLLVNHAEVHTICEKALQTLSIKTPSLEQQVMFLSGGNQQKVLVSRWLATSPDILILDEPTRGIDVGTKAEIYKLMSSLAQEGKAIILVPQNAGNLSNVRQNNSNARRGEDWRIDSRRGNTGKSTSSGNGEPLSTFQSSAIH
jgi:ABC-type sugar transport system ATPase subunit